MGVRPSDSKPFQLTCRRERILHAPHILGGLETLCTPKGLHITAQGRDAGAHPGKCGSGKPNPEGVAHPPAPCRTG